MRGAGDLSHRPGGPGRGGGRAEHLARLAALRGRAWGSRAPRDEGAGAAATAAGHLRAGGAGAAPALYLREEFQDGGERLGGAGGDRGRR